MGKSHEQFLTGSDMAVGVSGIGSGKGECGCVPTDSAGMRWKKKLFFGIVVSLLSPKGRGPVPDPGLVARGLVVAPVLSLSAQTSTAQGKRI